MFATSPHTPSRHESGPLSGCSKLESVRLNWEGGMYSLIRKRTVLCAKPTAFTLRTGAENWVSLPG